MARRRRPPSGALCLNGGMARPQHALTGRKDLEGFWPSRREHNFDEVCCRVTRASALRDLA
ncbi:hypothetical protein OG349_01990 [Streptomyces sp. NBC_01317]|nr:hypothetical protein OG349_01990 [Streptomyces sp. NBC_01317]